MKGVQRRFSETEITIPSEVVRMTTIKNGVDTRGVKN